MYATPQIYVASLEAYNAGRAIGQWVDATCEDSINDAIANLPGEEWAIHDFEDMPNLGENPPVALTVAVAKGIDEHGDAFKHWVDLGMHVSVIGCLEVDIMTAFEDSFQGAYDSVEKYGEQLVDDMGDLPSHYDYYLDFEAYGRAALMDYTVANDSDGTIYVYA